MLLLFTAGSLLPAALFAMFAYAAAGEPQPTATEQGGQQGAYRVEGARTFPLSRFPVSAHSDDTGCFDGARPTI